MADTYVDGVLTHRPFGGGRRWPKIWAMIFAISSVIGLGFGLWYVATGHETLSHADGGSLLLSAGPMCDSTLLLDGQDCFEEASAKLRLANGEVLTFALDDPDTIGYADQRVSLTGSAVAQVSFTSNLGDSRVVDVWVREGDHARVTFQADGLKAHTDADALPRLDGRFYAALATAVFVGLGSFYTAYRWIATQEVRWARWTRRFLIATTAFDAVVPFVIELPVEGITQVLGPIVIRIIVIMGISGWIEFRQRVLQATQTEPPIIIEQKTLT